MARRSRPHTPAAPVPAAPRARRWRPLAWALAAAAVVGAAWVGSGVLVHRVHLQRLPPPADLSGRDPATAREVRAAEATARTDASAEAVGELAMVYHASSMSDAARDAYEVAERLSPGDWRWPYAAGLLLEERGMHDDALAAFGRVTAAHPQYGLAWWHLAELHFKQGRLDDAAQAYQRARAASPAAAYAVPGGGTRQTTPLAVYAAFGLARIALERGDAPAARAAFEQIVQAHPRFTPARTLLRQSSAGAGDRTRPAPAGSAYVPPADPLLDSIVARATSTELLLKHAALAARGRDTAWRQFLVRRAYQLQPRALDVLLEMAASLQATGDDAGAVAVLRQAETVAPGDHHTLVELGRSLTELDRLAEAEQVLRQAARVQDAAAEYNLANVLDRQGRWEEAQRHYHRALAINPFHTRTMNNLAVGLDRRGDGAQALALYARALEIAPDDAEVHSNLGSALVGQRRLEEAIATLQTAVALDPDAPDARNNLGIALAYSGRFDEARQAFEAALRIAPAHPNARRNLQQLLAARRPR